MTFGKLPPSPTVGVKVPAERLPFVWTGRATTSLGQLFVCKCVVVATGNKCVHASSRYLWTAKATADVDEKAKLNKRE